MIKLGWHALSRMPLKMQFSVYCMLKVGITASSPYCLIFIFPINNDPDCIDESFYLSSFFIFYFCGASVFFVAMNTQVSKMPLIALRTFLLECSITFICNMAETSTSEATF